MNDKTRVMEWILWMFKLGKMKFQKTGKKQTQHHFEEEWGILKTVTVHKGIIFLNVPGKVYGRVSYEDYKNN